MLRNLILLCVFLSAMMSAGAIEYRALNNHLTTRWTSTVAPDKVWDEYPRPLLQRDEWKNLNGLWQYAITPKDAPIPTKWDGHILVPFCLESDLSGVVRVLDADHALWYRTQFRVPGKWKKKIEHGDLQLNFGAVDWEATIWVNGQLVGHHQGGYTAFTCSMGKEVKFDEDNEIILKVLDATDTGFQPCGKQRSQARGIWYTPVSGIWQTVWMEPVPSHPVTQVINIADIGHHSAQLTLCGGHQGYSAQVKVLYKGKKVTQADAAFGTENAMLTLALPGQLHLWTPDEPSLYDLEITVKDAKGKTIDRFVSYMAMREFGTARDDQGHVRFTLNGKEIFQFGLLDQGWWPDGLYTAPSPEALYYDIDQTKSWGYNLIRKHVKVEPELWYAHCDRVGIIVWQDMPSGDYGTSPEWQRTAYYRGPSSLRSKSSMDNYYREWEDIIDQFRAFPCIASWIPFNERWGQFNTWSVTAWTKQKDPTRLVNPASGGNFCCTGDVLDVHNYPHPAQAIIDPDRVNVVGEYGGIGYPVQGHTWVASDKNWGYIEFSSSKEVTDKYVEYAQMLLQLAQNGCSGAIYTQTTDCETEVNGIMTYDRKVVKMELDRFAEINRKISNYLNK